MLTGVKFSCYPDKDQRPIIHQWMGCARVIWNAKCQEDDYLRAYARKYMPIGTFPQVDQSYSQYKTDLTPWLKNCPSQILRNSCVNWFNTYQKFLKGICGRPKKKKKDNQTSIHLTKELFRLDKDEFGNWKIFIGALKNNIGFLNVKWHRKNFSIPKSLYLRQEKGKYFLSFCYDDDIDEEKLWELEQFKKHFRNFTGPELEEITLGVDRGIKVPVQAGDLSFNLTAHEIKKKISREKYRKKMQRKLNKQKKGSERRARTKKTLAKISQKTANVRENFCHHVSRALVKHESKILIFEDLKVKNMTKSSKGTLENPGKNVKSKSGLNRSILDQSWGKLENFVRYKAYRLGKAFFKVQAHYTSQECADCGYTHSNNRPTQEKFLCGQCGHSDNADRNASIVVKKRAIKLLLDSGTELSKRGVLMASRADKGRGGEEGSCLMDENLSEETSKKKKRCQKRFGSSPL